MLPKRPSRVRSMPMLAAMVLAVISSLATAAFYHHGFRNGSPAISVVEKAAPSLVYLEVENEEGETIGMGSGVFVAPGVVATCYHVIEGATRGYVWTMDSEYGVEVLGVVASDPERDAVLLHVASTDVPYLELCLESEQGERVFAMGNPFGFERTISEGIVSGRREDGEHDLIQFTNPISDGSSGGPLLKADGAVLGLAMGGLRRAQDINFAVSAGVVRELLSNMHEARPFESGDHAVYDMDFYMASRWRSQVHTLDCPRTTMIARRNEEVYRSLKAALQDGYEPCRECLDPHSFAKGSL